MIESFGTSQLQAKYVTPGGGDQIPITITVFTKQGEGVEAPFTVFTGCPLGCVNVLLGSREEGHSTVEDACAELGKVINKHVSEEHVSK